MAMFGRDDYNWLAQAWATILDATPEGERQVVTQACLLFADLLAKNSPGFDAVRFISNVTNANPLNTRN